MHFHRGCRMCVAVVRDNYPLDTGHMLPAHTITVMAPITLTNLLPHELFFGVGAENGRILPGGSADLHTANVDEHLEITVQLDGYAGSGTVNINRLPVVQRDPRFT